MRRFSRALIFPLLLLTPGAVLANDYTPSPEALARLSPEQALGIVSSAMARPIYLKRSGDLSPAHVIDLKAGLTRMVLYDDAKRAIEAQYAIVPLDVRYANFFDPPEIIMNKTSVYYNDSLSKEQFQAIVDALYVLKNSGQGAASPGDDPAFAQVVASYRAAQPKPSLPEDVRRYQVQAEAAVKDGAFLDAAQLYGQALAVAPWWPGGHFNRAAVLAEIGEYQTAMAEMQRYLLLTPDAPDARASQDKIYEWERKMNSQSLSTSAPLPKPVPAAK